MNKILKSLLALTLAALMCLLPVSCDRSGLPAESSDSVTEALTEAPKTFSPTFDYYIIRN